MPDGQNMRPVARRAAGLFVAAMLAAGVACTEKGRSVVLVDVTTTVTPLNAVTVVAARDGVEVGRTATAWAGGGATLKLGIYIPKDVSGTVTLHACGFLAGTGVAANTSPASATIQAGASVGPVAVALNDGPLSPLCAEGSGGKGGTTGGGGNGGTTGAGGSTGGGGGTTGVAGNGGNGGTTGGGGTTGTAGTTGGGG